MTGYIANTHHEWFDFLARKQLWDEVNFWNPSDYYAFRGEPGSPFFFRLKSPRNVIGGFGYVERFARLPEWMAWECFGEGNGAPSLAVMSERLAALRAKSDIKGGSEFKQIGCIILKDAVFFPREMWVAQPSNWKKNNLRYEGYSLIEGEGRRIWDECLPLAVALGVGTADEIPESDRKWGEPVLVRPRLGQGGFRVAVTEAYERACAVTGEHSLPALEAAHIRPFSGEGLHEIRNGLLLRSDLHRLFDRGYVTVTPEHRFEVSPLLKQHFDNGRSYYPLHGRSVMLPKRPAERPDSELLRWHNEHVFSRVVAGGAP
jgi:putative restriction endonuclease